MKRFGECQKSSFEPFNMWEAPTSFSLFFIPNTFTCGIGDFPKWSNTSKNGHLGIFHIRECLGMIFKIGFVFPHDFLGGGLNDFLFSPRNLGEMIQFDKHIFQLGWFNHQLLVVIHWNPQPASRSFRMLV